jgi:S-adenosylmethionine synthetase
MKKIKLKSKNYLWTSESVSAGHPDKICDACSDALLDHFMAFDPESHCAIETLATTGQVIVTGEVRSEAYVDIQNVVRKTINNIGYTNPDYQFDGNSCGILCAIHEQSTNINQGVSREDKENQGSGDQGLMIGYATNETDNYMPIAQDIAHRIVKTLHEIREEKDVMTYLRPDAKSQVTVEYDENDKPVKIHTIVVSTQHDDFLNGDEEAMQGKIRADVINILIPRVKASYSEKIQKLFTDDIEYYVNPTGVFIIGGPHGDTGLTGRKISVDSYGGIVGCGGGCQSGKDSSKTDRSGLYITRYIAKNAVAAGLADRMMIEISYAIGVADCLSFHVNTYGTAKHGLSDTEIAEKLESLFDLRPYAIIRDLKLKNPIYLETSSYGQVGQESRIVHKHFENRYGDDVDIDVELFTWEKLDAVDKIKKAFNLS